MSNIETVAEEILDSDNKIVLIYAFNATGKTRLSVAYKNLTKDTETGDHVGVYYNAFSEDLFLWNNDEESDGENIRLEVKPSNLNNFHSYISEDDLVDKLQDFLPTYQFRFNYFDDAEKGIESVSFYLPEAEDTPIKVSRGEERTFVWCFYLALLGVDEWSGIQDSHIFIDDPVSSLDEHNIYITANTVFKQIEENYLNKKIILTTHHIGLFSILSNRLGRNPTYRNIHERRFLKKDEQGLSLQAIRKNALPYHLHIAQLLNNALQDQLYVYHGVMLRQLIESVSAFLGDGTIKYVLVEIGVQDVEAAITAIHNMSHKDFYIPQSEFMPSTAETVFIDVFQKLLNTYKFKL